MLPQRQVLGRRPRQVKPLSQTSAVIPPFMRIPRELRDKIYHYVFFDAQHRPEPQYASWVLSSEVSSSIDRNFLFVLHEYNFTEVQNPTSFWGREPMTRLLRVSPTIGYEAAEVLYSGLKLSWPSWITKEDVQMTLKCCRPKAREMIKSIKVNIFINLKPNNNESSIELARSQSKHAIASLSSMLPGLRKVEVRLRFRLWRSQRIDIENSIEHVLDVLGPFQDLKLNTVEIKAHRKNGREGKEVVEQINKKILSGAW